MVVVSIIFKVIGSVVIVVVVVASINIIVVVVVVANVDSIDRYLEVCL